MDALADGGRDPGFAPASTRRELSFAARGTIAVVAGRQKMAPIAHARAAALGRESSSEPDTKRMICATSGRSVGGSGQGSCMQVGFDAEIAIIAWYCRMMVLANGN